MSEAPVLIAGAGPTGMTAALSLAHYGIPSILLDEDHVLSGGSRAIAYSADTLSAWERLGAAGPMLAKGITWSIRHTYFRDRELFTQNFPLPGAGFLPRFFNLPQYYVERYLLDRIEDTPLIDVRWDHKVIGCRENSGQVSLKVTTPAGEQEFRAAYVLACDGARSSLRKLLNLPFPGTTHLDYFIIADIRVDLDSPPEPRFFFDHWTNPGQTTLIHPQPDGIWRLDWQVGPEVDIEVERDPQRMARRIRPLIGDLPYEIVWLSSYRFHQRILERFRHGQIFFLGDAAHLVAPFGARGLNSAVADVENLVWKLVLVRQYGAPDRLLDTFQAERWPAQMQNQKITNTTMLFMSPPNRWQRFLRNLILRLSAFYLPARKKVDSGKMYQPFAYTNSPLLTPDDLPEKEWQGAPPLGSKAIDLPCSCWLGGELKPIFFRTLLGSGFVFLYFASDPAEGQPFSSQAASPRLPGIPVQFYIVLSKPPDHSSQESLLIDENGAVQKAFAARPGTLYLIRPDGHIAARRRGAQPSDLAAFLERASGMG